MAINWARGGLFAGGILVGAVLAGALFTQGGEQRGDTAAPPPAGALQQTAATGTGRRIDCSFAPIVTPASKEDGLLPLDKDLQGNSPAAVATLILSGKEAAAAGKPRDAETAFLMACRSAEAVKNDPIPLADAQYQLGRHYAQVAAPPDAPKRAELLKRAEALYASSLQVYMQHRGARHEKTRFAQEGLDALHRLVAGTAEPMVVTPNAEERRMAEATKVVGNAPQPAGAASAPAAAPPVAAAPVAKPRVTPAPAAKVPEPVPAEAPSQARSTEREQPAQRPATERAERTERAPAPERVERAPEPAPEPVAPARASRPEPAPAPAPVTRSRPVPEPAPVTRSQPAPEPAPVTRSRPAPEPVPVTRSRPAPDPAPVTRSEPEPAPRVVVPAPVAREPEPTAPPVDSMGGPPPTAGGSTDVPAE